MLNVKYLKFSNHYESRIFLAHYLRPKLYLPHNDSNPKSAQSYFDFNVSKRSQK